MVKSLQPTVTGYYSVLIYIISTLLYNFCALSKYLSLVTLKGKTNINIPAKLKGQNFTEQCYFPRDYHGTLLDGNSEIAAHVRSNSVI